ncbi:heavy metal-associated isoprenylated plant protein 6-like isoform X1 [Salvia splendens]|uniref:heavy metal-associated isoprenylated plant protein 6-like isoform X1 n=1 Tax=Salvia splendens TaxID=180675 RepID=UPI001C252A56|nr:heavy metal-associated isoprenylated plant protein 6-like isoform X1 [Salvia splendens]
MGEKVEVKNEGEKKAAAAAEGGEKIVGPITVVLKLDLHCQGCAKKVRRSVAHLQGVETVKAECDAKRLTVTGNVDPLWLREKLEIKTKKKVDLISPHPNNAAAGADHNIPQPVDTNSPKKAVVSTVTMKTKLHCDECADKIKRIIIKNFDGIGSLTTDLQKSLIIVIGTMDVNGLVTYVREKLKRGVEIVTPKKADGATTTTTTTVVENEVAAVDSKEKASGGEQENKGKKSDIVGESGAKQKEGGGDKKEAESKLMVAGGGETKVEMSKMEYHSSYNPQTHYAMPMMKHNLNYGHQDYSMHHHHSHTNTGYYGPPMPPPTYLDMNTNANDNMFSDENPNGCSLM